MDNIEQLAEHVIQAVEVLIDKRLRGVTDAIAAVRVEMKDAGYLKRDDVAGLASKEATDARIAGLDERLRELAADITARPTLDVLRAEAATAAGKAAAEMVAALPKPENGKSVTVDDVRPLLEQMVAAIPRPKDGAPGRDGVDGKDGVPGANGKDGRDGVDGKDGVPGANGKDGRDGVDGKDGAPGANGKDGRDGVDGKPGADGVHGKDGANGADGKDGDPGRDGKDATVDYNALHAYIIEKVVAATPPPAKDGIDGKDGRDGKAGVDGRNGDKGEKGEPGPAGKDADLATLRDIVAIAVKAAVADIPVPKDGAPGENADPVDMDAVASMLEVAVSRAVDALPKPKDGADGLSMKDVSIDLKEDGRTIVFRFLVEGVEKSFEIVCPWQIYREVFKAGTRYQRGDSVTYGGSQWFARKDTTQTPGTGDDWVLAVKRGRDGKDGSSE